jgi:hypothetical protein
MAHCFVDALEQVSLLQSITILFRSNFGISELRDDPIVVGGYDGHGTTEMCERFDWRANQWRGLPPLRFRRSALSLFRLDNLAGVERFFAPPTDH